MPGQLVYEITKLPSQMKKEELQEELMMTMSWHVQVLRMQMQYHGGKRTIMAIVRAFEKPSQQDFVIDGKLIVIRTQETRKVEKQPEKEMPKTFQEVLRRWDIEGKQSFYSTNAKRSKNTPTASQKYKGNQI